MRKCRSSQLGNYFPITNNYNLNFIVNLNILEIPLPQNIKSFTEIKDYVYNLKVIDNQKILTQLSNNLEPRRT